MSCTRAVLLVPCLQKPVRLSTISAKTISSKCQIASFSLEQSWVRTQIQEMYAGHFYMCFVRRTTAIFRLLRLCLKLVEQSLLKLGFTFYTKWKASNRLQSVSVLSMNGLNYSYLLCGKSATLATCRNLDCCAVFPCLVADGNQYRFFRKY